MKNLLIGFLTLVLLGISYWFAKGTVRHMTIRVNIMKKPIQ